MRVLGTQKRNRSTGLALLLALMTALVVAAAAGATVWTDQDDYAPGSVVTISGDNSNAVGYLVGETVRVDVSGPNGWTATFDAIAGDTGAWSGQVTLSDGEDAAGTYTYTATGLTSTVTETGTFTDGGFRLRAVIPGGTLVVVTFPAQSIEGFANATCTAPRNKYNGDAFATLTTGYRIVGGFNTAAGTSVKIVPPSPVTIGAVTYAFSSWTISNGSVQTTGTTGCFSGWSAATDTYVTANYVVSDTTPPTVNITAPLAAPGNVVDPTETSVNVVWNATEAGTYSVRVGGTTCTTGTEVENGSYTSGSKTTNILATELAYGVNTIRVCVTDAATNTGSATVTIYRQVPTLLTYTGDTQVLFPGPVVLKGTLTASDAACSVAGKTISFGIDLNGNFLHFDAGEQVGTAVTNSSGTATLTLASGQIPVGVYGLRIEFAGTNECARDVDENGIIAVVSPDDAATGGGWYQIAGVTGVTKAVNFGFTTRWDKNAGAYRGQILVKNKEAWRLKGEITAFAKISATEGEIMGTAQLFCWNPSAGDWRLADDSVTFKAIFTDYGSAKGKGSTTKPDSFTVSRFGDYTPAAGCPTAIQPLRKDALQALKGGNISIK